MSRIADGIERVVVVVRQHRPDDGLRVAGQRRAAAHRDLCGDVDRIHGSGGADTERPDSLRKHVLVASDQRTRDAADAGPGIDHGRLGVEAGRIDADVEFAQMRAQAHTVLAAVLGLDVGSARYAIGHAGRDPYPLAAVEQEVPNREVAAGRGQSGAFPLVLVVPHQGQRRRQLDLARGLPHRPDDFLGGRSRHR